MTVEIDIDEALSEAREADFYASLNPGIREVVRLLRDHGFDTTDSGDGVTNVAVGMEGALDVPHVHCASTWHGLVGDSRHLRALLDRKGLMSPAVQIQAVYSPIDEVATVSLYGLSDADLSR